MEIICISCWRAFDHDTSTTAAQVTCPHCGFSQPGPDPSSLSAKLDANTRPSEVVSDDEGSAPDASTTDPEMPVMQAKAPDEPAPEASKAPSPEPEASRPQTMDFGAVPIDVEPTQPSPAKPKVAAPEAPPKPDHRWRLRTPARLILYFPDYEGLSRYLSGNEGAGYAVACGPGPFRTLTGFISAMRVTNDPLEALVNVPPDDETAPMGSKSTPPIARPRPSAQSNASGQQQASLPEQPAAPGKSGSSDKAPQSRPRTTRRRRTSANTDFSFRKPQEQNPWPGRLLFLLLGMLTGGALIYYVAWIGLLPGIVY